MTKLEEVARAIYEGRNGQGAKPWARLPDAHKSPYLADVRAAAAALRMPSDRQWDAGHAALEEHGDSHRAACWAYRAMIDAILSEGE